MNMTSSQSPNADYHLNLATWCRMAKYQPPSPLSRKFFVSLRAMDSKNKTFDKQVARQWCMEYGTLVGSFTSISFLCAMYGLQYTWLGQVSNLLALLAFLIAIRTLRHFCRNIFPLTFGQACWMVVQIYFFAILLTAAVQFIYFQFFDHGRLVDQMNILLDNEAYRNWIAQMAPDTDTDTMIGQTLATLRNPVHATMQLMLMNCIAALMLTIPTTLFGYRPRFFYDEDSKL